MKDKLQRLWDTKNKNDEWWSSFVTSPLAVAANCVVVDYKWLSPNLITLISFIVAIVAAAFIVGGTQTHFYIAAILIHASHVLDCMDGQMARYRGVCSRSGGFYDRVTDQIQVFIWFGAIGYAAYIQTGDFYPILLAFVGVGFYSLRGYVKYVVVYIEMSDNKEYLVECHKEISEIAEKKEAAGLGHGIASNVRWFLGEQRKFFSFDEGVFIFILSVALVFNALMPMLWVFAASQIFRGIFRCIQRGRQLDQGRLPQILTVTEK